MKPEFQPEFEAILKKLQVNDPSLTSLMLDSKEITDADIKKLAIVLPSNRTLRALNLSGNQIDDAMKKTLEAFINRNIQLAGEAYRAAAEENVDQVRQALQQGVSLFGHRDSNTLF